jgi:hypothetical protein
MPRKKYKPLESYQEIRRMKPSSLGDVTVTIGGRKKLVNKKQALYDAGDPVQRKITDKQHETRKSRHKGPSPYDHIKRKKKKR